MELGGGRATSTRPNADPTVFSMEDIRLEGGKVQYASNLLRAPVSISGLQANCTRITSESARMDFGLRFNIDGGGEVGGSFKIDTDKSLYAVNVAVSGFNLAPLLPYLQDFMHTTALRGSLDLGLKLQDSWADTAALAVSGRLALHALGITDGAGANLIGLRQGLVVLDTLNARSRTFKIDQVRVDGLDTRFQQWADGSNTWTKALKLSNATTADSSGMVLAANPANIFVMLADYIRLLGQEFVANQYTADSLQFVDGTLAFEDFTPEKPFRYHLDQVSIRSSRITTAAGTAGFSVSARLNQRGMATSTFRFDPKDFRNVDALVNIKGLSLPDLDAYSRWYGAYPILSGTLAYSGQTSIKDGQLDSRNQLEADNLRFGKKTNIHDTGIVVLPLRLAASLLRDVHGVINLEVPVQGDLNDPKFKPWPIVWQVLKNLAVKAAAAPIRLVAGALGSTGTDDLEELRFAPLQTRMGKDQEKALGALAETLKKKPELDVALVPLVDPQQAREEWAAWLAKKEYVSHDGGFSPADSLRAMGLSLRDTAFKAYLDGKVPATAGQPEVERCIAAVGAQAVDQAVAQAAMLREKAVLARLEEAGANAKQISFRAGRPDEVAGRLGAPGYRFVMDVHD